MALRTTLIVFSLAALALAGCSAAATAQPSISPLPAQSPLRPAAKGATPMPPSPSASALLASQARHDLADRLAMPLDQVTVVSITATEMPIGSLGCGETGSVTQPGIIIGQEIILSAGGRDYTYRTDGQQIKPCTPADFPGGRGPAGADRQRAQAMAVRDLAGRANVAATAVKVIRVEEVEWPDASLGCPQPGMMYAQVITPGYRLELEAAGKRYTYHASDERVILCTR